MNRPREVTDNAHMESFFHSMKTDAVHGVSLASHGEVARLLRGYIPYYNRVRLHSGSATAPRLTMKCGARRNPW